MSKRKFQIGDNTHAKTHIQSGGEQKKIYENIIHKRKFLSLDN